MSHPRNQRGWVVGGVHWQRLTETFFGGHRDLISQGVDDREGVAVLIPLPRSQNESYLAKVN